MLWYNGVVCVSSFDHIVQKVRLFVLHDPFHGAALLFVGGNGRRSVAGLLAVIAELGVVAARYYKGGGRKTWVKLGVR